MQYRTENMPETRGNATNTSGGGDRITGSKPSNGSGGSGTTTTTTTTNGTKNGHK